eukprot:7510152-Pyramimonas_sp.AAC.1
MVPDTSTGRSHRPCALRPATWPPPCSAMPSASGTKNGRLGPASTATLEAAPYLRSASPRPPGTPAPPSALLVRPGLSQPLCSRRCNF